MLLHLERQFWIYGAIGIVTSLLGLSMCVGGFWLWYVRVQKLLDAANSKTVG